MSLFAAVISIICNVLAFPCQCQRTISGLGRMQATPTNRIDLNTSRETSLHQFHVYQETPPDLASIQSSTFAPPRGLNFIRPTISRILSVDVSVTSETWLIASSPLLTARSALGHRPCGICAMLYVSQHPRPCEPWSPRRWWCVVGILGARSVGGAMGWIVEDGGYIGGRRVLLCVNCFTD
jgi:hypothetical protein